MATFANVTGSSALKAVNSISASPTTRSTQALSHSCDAMGVTNTSKEITKSTSAKFETVAKPSHTTGLHDGSNSKRTPMPKAWTSGNPLTQRVSASSQPSGNSTPTYPTKADHSQQSTHTSDSSDRLLFLLANAIGRNVSVQAKNGDLFSGIFFGSHAEGRDINYQLKMVSSRKSDGDDLVGIGEDHSMSFKAREVNITLDGISLSTTDRRTNGSSGGFRTDTQISGNRAGQERELQHWVAPRDSELDQALETSSSSATWDQFQANANLFGVKSDYDEHHYTTRIDKSHPNYRQREANAIKIAAMMGESMTGEANEGQDMDEEDKYSGVRRERTDYAPLKSSQPDRYQPPARRAPTGKPTVHGAPVDPAIISATIARPNNSISVALSEVDSPENIANPRELSNPRNQKVEPLTDDVADTTDPKTGQIEKKSDLTSTDCTNVSQTQDTARDMQTNTLNAFKSFREKQLSRVADDRRQRALQDRTSKLNELKAFSKNFRLNIPIPKDLVPILAKDKSKAEDLETHIGNTTSTDLHSRQPTQHAGKLDTINGKDNSKKSRISPERNDSSRQTTTNRGNNHVTMPLRNGGQPISSQSNRRPGELGLSQRLAKNNRDRLAGISVQMPIPMPIHSPQKSSVRAMNPPERSVVPQASGNSRVSTSHVGTKPNAKAHDFVPNAAAVTFVPGSRPNASPTLRSQVGNNPIAHLTTASDFWGGCRPSNSGERQKMADHFDTLKCLKERATKDGKTKDYQTNGGIPPAHATPVTWTVVKDDTDGGPSYKDLLDQPLIQTDAIGFHTSGMPLGAGVNNQTHFAAHLQPGAHHTAMGMGAMPGYYTTGLAGSQYIYTGTPNQYDDHQQRLLASGMVVAPHMMNFTRGNGPVPPYVMPAGQSMPIPAYNYPFVGTAQNPTLHPQSGGSAIPLQYRQFSNVSSSSSHGPLHTPVSLQHPQHYAPLMMQQSSQGHYGQIQGQHSGIQHPYSQTAPPYTQSAYSIPPMSFPSPGRPAVPAAGGTGMVQQGSYQGHPTQFGAHIHHGPHQGHAQHPNHHNGMPTGPPQGYYQGNPSTMPGGPNRKYM